MKSTLRDKIKLQIQEAFQDGHYFADGYDGKVRGTADGRTDAILKEVEKEVIGEDRPEVGFGHKDWIRNSAYNQLLAEQRAKLSTLKKTL